MGLRRAKKLKGHKWVQPSERAADPKFGQIIGFAKVNIAPGDGYTITMWAAQSSGLPVRPG